MECQTLDKRALFDDVLARLREMADRAENARRSSQEDANTAEGRMASRYNTFVEEAQYLEAGQQHRQAEISNWIRQLESLKFNHPEIFSPSARVRVGSVVTVAIGSESALQSFFILPVATGGSVEGGGKHIQPLSLSAALAGRLLGRKAGDRIEGAPHGNALPIRILELE